MRLGSPLHHQLLALLKTDAPAHLGSGARGGTLAINAIDAHLNLAFKETRINSATQDLLRGGLYLWHDHLAEAHAIAQEIETADGSLLHAIMHRREPDYPNAKYWFRRAGSHPSFLALAAQAAEVLNRVPETDLQSRLLPNKTWDPFAFVDEVEDVQRGEFRSRVPLLEEIQKLEMQCFLENIANRAV
jgi:hypothetical protein